MTRQLNESEFTEKLPLSDQIAHTLQRYERAAEHSADESIRSELEKAFPGKKYKLAVKAVIAYSLLWVD